MTKSEMKKIMKPLVKECLQEMLLQEGLLSNLISEVMKGQNKSVVTESVQRQKPNTLKQETKPAKSVEQARKFLSEKIGGADGSIYSGIFENMKPAENPGQNTSDPGMDLDMLNSIPGLRGKF